MQSHTDVFDFPSLPRDLKPLIFNELSLGDLFRISKVNKEFYLLAQDIIWQHPQVIRYMRAKESNTFTYIMNQLDSYHKQVNSKTLFTESVAIGRLDTCIFFLSTLVCLGLAAGLFSWLVDQYHRTEDDKNLHKTYLGAALAVGIPSIIFTVLCCVACCISLDQSDDDGCLVTIPSKEKTISHQAWKDLVTFLDHVNDQLNIVAIHFPDIKPTVQSLEQKVDALDRNALKASSVCNVINGIKTNIDELRGMSNKYLFFSAFYKERKKLIEAKEVIIHLPKQRKFK